MTSAKDRIETILQKEGLELSNEVIETVIQIAKGDMRKVINLFQSIHLQITSCDDPDKIQLESGLGSEFTPENVYKLTGTLPPSHIKEIFRSLMNDDLEGSLKSIKEKLDSSDANVASMLPHLTQLVLEEMQGNRVRNMKMDVLNLLADVEKKAARDIPEALLRDYMISQFFILRNLSSM